MKTFRSLKYNTPKRLKLINLYDGTIEHVKIVSLFYPRYINTKRIISLIITLLNNNNEKFNVEILLKDLNYSGYYCFHNQFCLCITNEAVLEIMNELESQAITLLNNVKYYKNASNKFKR